MSFMAVGKDDHAHAYDESVNFINEVTSKCDEIQGKVLAEILSQNAETEYLKRHGMVHGGVDRETFKTRVPIVTYKDIKPDIMRIYNGDYTPILCAQPFSELWISTGTSDAQEKLLPATDQEKVRRDNLSTTIMPFIKRRIEGPEANKGKGFSLLITREETVTPNGLLLCTGLTSVFKNPRFYRDNPYPNNYNTSPMEAIYCTDHFQSVYTQLLCGFYQRHDVSHAKAVFGSSIIWAVHFLKQHYLDICHDIESGSLSTKITDPSLRVCMIKTFMQHPDPMLANVIRAACMGENWEGIFRKIWPNIKYVETIVTGSMAQYIPMLNYYSGGLPLVCVKYSASECDLGFNLNPMCDPYNVSYTIMPNMAYYEFIPLELLSDYGSSELPPRTVDMANVEVGKEYELVVTNYCGLYRYKVGDVLSPTGFYNSTPQFKFMRRKNVLLSMDLAKTTEIELQTAIDKVSSLLHPFNTQIIDYTSCAEMKTTPGHYVIYLELMTTTSAGLNGLLTPEILEQCCSAMEGYLGVYYRWCRGDGSIGPLEIRVVKNGTFEKVRDYAISELGSSFIQFKIPRCVKSVHMLDVLNFGVVSTHFSPSVPRTD
ncbi:putative indole-3-acetic acid-amido synthetase GH3.1 [Silene latifolia]|uniref:putative indole-3-acetic acid-amido synthetase GH3.1 n=1 Tax=Silene latifolia TaxID=37657 RepID=UPI003D77A1E5